MNNPSEDAYRKSIFYEQLVEHVFVSEVLQRNCGTRFGKLPKCYAQR